MGLFDFFRKPSTVQPPKPARAVVQFDEEMVTCTRTDGLVERVRWSDLGAVLIKTTANGPFVDDLFWALIARDVKSGCILPSEADGCDRLLKRLQELPGFDNEAAILAAQCVEERDFLCWQRSDVT